MATDETVRIGLDAKQFTTAANKVTAGLKKINASLSDVGSVLEKVDSEGKVLSLTFNGMTKDGLKFTGMVEKQGRALNLTSLEAERLTKALTKQQQAGIAI